MTVLAAPTVRPRPTAKDLHRFIDVETEPGHAALVPEIELHLAHAPRLIFQAADDLFNGHLGSRPYWAFAWPGGQAIARVLLDHPELVAGKRVLDMGAGSGLGAIAASMAGARSVVAADIDPLAATVCARNAALNQVEIAVRQDDLLGAPPACDVLLIGDLVYEPDLLQRVGALVDDAAAAGALVLYGDRTTARRPARRDFKLIYETEAALTPPLVDDFIDRARVWKL
jgi:predicted nicotinamide N-methyase